MSIQSDSYTFIFVQRWALDSNHPVNVYVSVKRVEVVERNLKKYLPLPLLSCESRMLVQENQDGKKYKPLVLIIFWKVNKLFPLRRVTRGGEGGGEVSPALFRKLEKSALIWRKNALIVVIYGYDFSFKMRFLRVSRGKICRFLACGIFLSHVVGECLSKYPNSKKTPLL